MSSTPNLFSPLQQLHSELTALGYDAVVYKAVKGFCHAQHNAASFVAWHSVFRKYRAWVKRLMCDRFLLLAVCYRFDVHLSDCVLRGDCVWSQDPGLNPGLVTPCQTGRDVARLGQSRVLHKMFGWHSNSLTSYSATPFRIHQV